jgi:hypothetical protein
MSHAKSECTLAKRYPTLAEVLKKAAKDRTREAYCTNHLFHSSRMFTPFSTSYDFNAVVDMETYDFLKCCEYLDVSSGCMRFVSDVCDTNYYVRNKNQIIDMLKKVGSKNFFGKEFSEKEWNDNFYWHVSNQIVFDKLTKQIRKTCIPLVEFKDIIKALLANFQEVNQELEQHFASRS